MHNWREQRPREVAIGNPLDMKGHGSVLMVLGGGKGWMASASLHVTLTRPLPAASGQQQRADGGCLLHHAGSDQQFQRGNPQRPSRAQAALVSSPWPRVPAVCSGSSGVLSFVIYNVNIWPHQFLAKSLCSRRLRLGGTSMTARLGLAITPVRSSSCHPCWLRDFKQTSPPP